MATPSTGSISMAQIAAEFGGTAPHSLDEYYGVASGVPSSGTIDFNSLRGKSNLPPQSITIHGYITDDEDDYNSIFYTAQNTETIRLLESGISTGTFEMRAGTWVVFLDNGYDDQLNLTKHLNYYNLPSNQQYYIASILSMGNRNLRPPQFRGLTSNVLSNVGVLIASIDDNDDGD